MRSAIIAGSTTVVTLALSVACLGGYWHYKVAPLMARAELKVMPHAFVPVRVGEVRKFDLGYATFSLPSSAAGEFYHKAGEPIVVFGSAPKPPYPMAFFCPVDGNSKQYRELLNAVATMSGNLPMSWYEYQKFVLAQQPFTFWDAIRQGLKETRLRFVLLASKMMSVGVASDVRVFEKNGIGILVFRYPQGGANVMISSLSAGSFQNVWIGFPDLSVDEIVSALAESYEPKVRDYNSAAITLQIEQAGITPAIKQ